MHLVPQPLSSYSDDPPDDIVFCCSISDSTLIVTKDEVIDRAGVAQPTCIVIHEEYGWELEYQHSVKYDSLLSEPPILFLEIFVNLPSMI